MLRTSFLLGIGLMLIAWSATARATTHLETEPPVIAEGGGYISVWWWLVILAIVVAAAAWYFMRKRRPAGRI